MSIEVNDRRFVPAVKCGETDEVFKLEFGEEIHGDIYKRLAKERGLYYEHCRVYDIMKDEGFWEGYIEVGSTNFLDRDDVEELFGIRESLSMRDRGLIEYPIIKVFA